MGMMEAKRERPSSGTSPKIPHRAGSRSKSSARTVNREWIISTTPAFEIPRKVSVSIPGFFLSTRFRRLE